MTEDRQSLIIPLEENCTHRIRAWEQETYEPCNKYPEALRYETNAGEYVRSKSEVIIANLLHMEADQLLYKYPNIRFVENPIYNEANNISSAVCVRYLLQNAYVLEADLLLRNKKLIRKYEYETNFLSIPVESTDDWCFATDHNGVITEEKVGGTDCHQMVGISYWSEADGIKLANDLNEVYLSQGGKERYWEQVPLVYKKENYQVHVRECKAEDITEIDTFNELKAIDNRYVTG